MPQQCVKYLLLPCSKVIFGLNAQARRAKDSPWDPSFYGVDQLVTGTYQRELPVVGWELGNEPDLFLRKNFTVPPKVFRTCEPRMGCPACS